MNCTTCQYSSIDLGNSPQAGKLICRLNPPTPAAIAIPTPNGITVQVLTIWATVTQDDHCAEHLSLPLGKLK